MKINKSWESNDNQSISIYGKTYNIHACFVASKDIPAKNLLIDDLFIGYSNPSKETLRSFIEHIKMVNDADLKYPILMNEDGEIIDGKHRLAKAILLGHKTIKAKRFIHDPSGCYTTD